jgi:hypothetical protein
MAKKKPNPSSVSVETHKFDPPDLDLLIERAIESKKPAKIIDHIGLLIDASGDRRSSTGTTRAFELLEHVRARRLTAKQAVVTHYFAANAWHNRRGERPKSDHWSWEQPEVREQILELRRARRHKGFSAVEPVRRSQIRTNLGNQLSFIGRFIEALEEREPMVRIDGRLAMPLGNQAITISTYARALYDPGHARLMLLAAKRLFSRALGKGMTWELGSYEGAKEEFGRHHKWITDHVDLTHARRVMFKNHSLGKTPEEQTYRQWCLSEKLFLNPLNDLGPLTIAGRDVLTLPPMRTPVAAKMPWTIGFFNQMKQEFVSARYMYYRGVTSTVSHFSDHGVLLLNTLDYPSYALAVERQRTAFRVAYSILDKIGFFLNSYFSVGRKPQDVSFRKIWYEKDNKTLLRRLVNNKNWPLRGLFWLSKDLFDKEMHTSTEPDARALDEMRNRLEHRYLQVHEIWAAGAGIARRRGNTESPRYSVSRDNLEDKTLRLLKLSRAALIYLSLAVHQEERVRHKRRTTTGLIAQMPIDTWEDDWKR